MTAVLVLLFAVWVALTVWSLYRLPHVHIPRPTDPEATPRPEWCASAAAWVTRRPRFLDEPVDPTRGASFGAGVSPWPVADLSARVIDLRGLNPWPSAYGGQTAELPRVVA